MTAPLPTVNSITPTTAQVNTLTRFVITGANFTNQTAYQIQGADCPNKRFVSSTRLEMDCKHSAVTTLVYTVKVVSGGADVGGQSRGNISFTGPVVSSISPTSAPVNILTSFVISGTGFTNQTAYQIQGADCPNKRFINSSRLEMDCQHNVVTTLEYTVKVITLGANAGGNARGNINFTAGAVVSNISPTNAPVNTLTTFVISGTGFTNQTAYQIQGADCPNKRFISSTRLEMDCQHNVATTLEYTVKVVTLGANAGGNARGNITFTNVDQAPTVSVQSNPSVSGNQLTASVLSSDDNDVTRSSFTIFQPSTSSAMDIASSVSVTSPASTYNPTPRSWGYNPASATTTTAWNIDISGLPDGDYDIEFHAGDSVNAAADSGKYRFTKSSTPVPTVISVTPATTPINTLTTFVITGTDFTNQTAYQIQSADCPDNNKRFINSSRLEMDCQHNVVETLEYSVKVVTEGADVGGQARGNISFTTAVAGDVPTILELNIIESDTVAGELTFTVPLSGPLPGGYGVFINFDNLQGEWFTQADLGGHRQLTDQGGNIYTRSDELDEPGLRTFRAGIFKLSDDTLVGDYTAGFPCLAASCLAAITEINGYGNPAITGSGSQLFKNVDVANGNYHLAVTDISVTGKGPSFNFSRAYNSLSEASKQWTFGYEMKASYTDNNKRQIEIGPREDGHMQHFFQEMNEAGGDWYSLNPGNFDQLVKNANGSFSLYTQGNRIYEFADPDKPEAGRLEKIKDRLANALTFNYSSNNLVGATDANGRSYTITRDSNNHIQRVTDFTGRYVEYSYNINDMINTVRNVRGDSQNYRYAGNFGDARYQLATITDPRNEVQVTIDYISVTIDHISTNKVDALTNGVGDITDFSYGTVFSGGPQGTGISQPSVDGENHNIVYVLDDKRTRVVERVDAKNYGDAFSAADISTKQEYLMPGTRKQLAEQSLVKRIVDPKNAATIIGYDIVAKGRPVSIEDAEGLISLVPHPVNNQ